MSDYSRFPAIDPEACKLSLEQDLQLKIYSDSVLKLNEKQAKDLLVMLIKQLQIKDNLVKHLFKKIV